MVPSCLAAAEVMETWSEGECFSFVAAAAAAATVAASSAAGHQTDQNC